MSLPKLTVPTFAVTVPSLNKKIMMKSLTAKEYKLLLVAKEDANEEQRYITTKQLLNNCILDSNIDIDDLKMFDLEYLFLHMMTSSTANKMPKLSYRCNNIVDDVICNTMNTIAPDISKAKVDVKGSPHIIIECQTNDDELVALKFSYPALRYVNSQFDMMSMIAASMESVSTAEEVLKLGKDYSLEDALDFIENLTEEQVTKVIEFANEIPRLTLDHKFECKGCGFVHNIKLEGLSDFFM